MQELTTHPLGETKPKALIPLSEPVTVKTFSGWTMLSGALMQQSPPQKFEQEFYRKAS